MQKPPSLIEELDISDGLKLCVYSAHRAQGLKRHVAWSDIRSLLVVEPDLLNMHLRDGSDVQVPHDNSIMPLVWACAFKAGARIPRLRGESAPEILRAARESRFGGIRSLDQFLVLLPNVETAARLGVIDLHVPSVVGISDCTSMELEYMDHRLYPKFDGRIFAEPEAVPLPVVDECLTLLELGVAQIGVVRWPRPTHYSAAKIRPELIRVLHAPTLQPLKRCEHTIRARKIADGVECSP